MHEYDYHRLLLKGEENSERLINYWRIVLSFMFFGINRMISSEIPPHSVFAINLIVSIYIVFAISCILYIRAGKYNPTLKYVSTFVDIALLSMVIWMFGTYRTFKTQAFLLYYMWIAMAAVRFSFRLTIFAGVLSMGLFSVIVIAGIKGGQVELGTISDSFVSEKVSILNQVIKIIYLGFVAVALAYGSRAYKRISEKARAKEAEAYDRMCSEEALRSEHETLEHVAAGREVELDLLQRVNTAANLGEPLDELVKIFIKGMRMRFDFSAAFIYLKVKDKNIMECRAYALSDDLAKAASKSQCTGSCDCGLSPDKTEGIFSFDKGGRPLFIPSRDEVAEVIANCVGQGFFEKASIADDLFPDALYRMPLHVSTEVVGAVDVAVKGEFNAEIEATIMRLAENLALVIHKKQDEQRLQIYTRKLVEHTEELREAKSRIDSSLKEKEVLLQEVHHRVKNNMAIITSLLSLQSKYVSDAKSLELLKESQSRIRTMAIVHEMLYRTSNFASIKLKDYVSSLAESVKVMFAKDREVHINLEFKEDISLDMDTLIPCGLIINELLTNSLVHAKRGTGTLEIMINVARLDNGHISLRVSDNGQGLPDEFDFSGATGLGLKLVGTLADQLGGNLEVTSGPGVSYDISFPEIQDQMD